MAMQRETLAFSEEAQVRMQALAEFLAKDTRVNLALTSQLHDEEILLTPGGFLMLAIPLIEGGQLQEQGGAAAPVSPDVVRQSVGALLASIKQEPAAADARMREGDARVIVVGRKPSLLRRTKPIELGPRETVRSSLSVIRAFWRRYCTIPPFCDDAK